MRPRPSSLLQSSCLFFLCLLPGTALAQQPTIEPRITHAVDEASTTLLRGNVHPLARVQRDIGVAPTSLPMQRMPLVLKRSDQQEATLRQLLDEQQDKSSPNYHRWLTPDDFGRRFGPADQDIQTVTSWPQSHGFQISQVSKGRTVIEFSGTASMVQEAFHASIHKYVAVGASHWANASDPSIPIALTPVVAGVWTLHSFPKKPTLLMSPDHFSVESVRTANPQATGSNGHHFLTPGDFAVIYTVNPVYSTMQGSGVTIAVVARSDLMTSDIFTYRQILGLPYPSLSIMANGPDPGDLGGGEEAEVVLDTTWSGAVAPQANVQLVISASTDTTDGADLSAIFIVDNNLGDVMTESFSTCEANATSSELAGMTALAEQAAAQGITYIVSSGDTGSAGCDDLSETRANGPLSVNALASTAFNVAVGGTIFNENGHDSSFWSSTTSTPVTALKYIPENVWNESSTNSTSPSIAAGGGGPSANVPKPFWQAGVQGIPNDSFRDVPDVSLSAAIHDPYLICLAGSCNQGNQSFLAGIGGTSASAPSFAGIMALVVQKNGERVGAANYVLYRLAAAETFSQCNGSSTSSSPTSSCVFNDVTSGNNAVPGEASYGTSSPQYKSGTGYDLATGLGLVNVASLVGKWSSVTYNPTTTSLTLAPLTNILHGSAVTANITVTPTSGSAKPTGDVSLLSVPGTTVTPQGLTMFTLSNGSAAGTTRVLPGGTYSIKAHYAGDANYSPSESTPVQVTVTPEASNTTVKVLSSDASGNPIPFTSGPYGTFVYPRADVSAQSGYGVPSGVVYFEDNGAASVDGDPYTLNSKGNTAPPNGLFRFAAGPHALSAMYNGDLSFNPSTSSAVNFTITQATPTVTLTASPSSAVSPTTSVAFSVTIKTSSGGLAPEGNVTFYSGTTSLGSAGVFGETAGGITTNGTFVTASSQAGLTTTLPTGADSITGQYGGDGNYVAATSTPVNITVAPDFTLAFGAPSITVASPGGSGNLTLTITGQSGYNGTINLAATSCTGMPFGAACSFSPASITGSGQSTLTVTTTAPTTRVAPGTSASTSVGGAQYFWREFS